MIIEAKNFDEAYQKATDEFNCSITELNITTIQAPSNGIFGLFKKNVIIEVKSKGEKKLSKKVKEEKKETKTKSVKEPNYDEIKQGLKKLFDSSYFDIDKINVKKFDKDTILIELDGKDAALLIGKEGYRYKALSYLLYNWINLKYGYSIRLEISQFLKNQETMIKNYLENIITKVETHGKAQTKPLDGILVKIALEQLREKFPNKYVGIKQNSNGKYIVINDFHKK